jgi:hypothetical protein
VRADDDAQTKALYGNWFFLDLMEYLPVWMRPNSVHKAVSMCQLDYALRYHNAALNQSPLSQSLTKFRN